MRIHNISGGVKFPQGYGLAWSLSASLDDIVGIAFEKYNYKETVGYRIIEGQVDPNVGFGSEEGFLAHSLYFIYVP